MYIERERDWFILYACLSLRFFSLPLTLVLVVNDFPWPLMQRSSLRLIRGAARGFLPCARSGGPTTEPFRRGTRDAESEKSQTRARAIEKKKRLTIWYDSCSSIWWVKKKTVVWVFSQENLQHCCWICRSFAESAKKCSQGRIGSGQGKNS